MSITASQISNMLAFMIAQIGKPYSESSGRFGPSEYDCSGLVFTAANQAGITIPGSASADSGDVLANTEIDYLASLPGAQVITSQSQIKTGDIVGFTGASPDPSNYGPIGHIGMAVSNSTLVSAFDTQSGVTETPMSQSGGFVVAVRLLNATIPTPSGAGGTTGSQGVSSIFSIPSQITGFFGDAKTLIDALMWIVNPASWLRIGAFFAGTILIIFAIYALMKVGSDEPLFKMPQVVPVPI
jgi:Bacteriophage peptidoglycan hydrolase